MSSIVENPELGRAYNVRRFRSGSPQKRYQAAIIEDTMLVDSCRVHVVRWLYDGIYENVMDFYGLVKTLSQKELSNEQDQCAEQLRSLRYKQAVLDDLVFNPKFSSLLTG